MFHILHFLQYDMVLGIANSSEKSCLISTLFPLTYIDVMGIELSLLAFAHVFFASTSSDQIRLASSEHFIKYLITSNGHFENLTRNRANNTHNR